MELEKLSNLLKNNEQWVILDHTLILYFLSEIIFKIHYLFSNYLPNTTYNMADKFDNNKLLINLEYIFENHTLQTPDLKTETSYILFRYLYILLKKIINENIYSPINNTIHKIQIKYINIGTELIEEQIY